MSVLRANVEYALSIAKARDKKPYGYGGVWVANNINRTTDCSGIVTHMLDALTRGQAGMRWSRLGISTESYRYVGGPGSKGPFGTIRVARPSDIPADAALKIGLQHGPGGGANSHMACTLQGLAIESSGSYGQRVGGPARGYNHPLFHDWFYLPGPIVGSGNQTPPPTNAPGTVILGEDYENTGERVLALQKRLNANDEAYSDLEEDGEYGPATAAVVREFQSRSNLTIDGIAGPATLAALGLSFQPQEIPMTDSEKLTKILDNTIEIRKQLSVEGDPSWKNKGKSPRDLLYAIASKLGA
ncbi:Putative peptidoglycan binding domain-containing protein [Mycolicibacterium neoaurum]|uniref:peptidoglycan-binding domain-containing protein n=1 Tax=Mycolicibacterium neoaurum TaxID=1795 RepID=UPI00088B6891|nr:peptidoglycan-binding domain-containing protein [Mycolicibacterium neoaurum]SDD58222.1 Putative peptidoglycan binding domain-containing protein [Mycolicibacterium neoaurum]